MLRSLVVLSLVGCALGQFFSLAPRDGMKSYSDKMVMEACLGKSAMDDMASKMEAAVNKCFVSPQDNEIQMDFSILPPMAAMLPPSEMKEKQDRATAFAANATCILLEMNYINADGSPNYEACESWIKSLNITAALTTRLLEAHNLCMDFANCAPVETVKCPITRRFGRMMAYKKCHSMKICECCTMENRRMMMAGNNKMNPDARKMMMDLEDILMYGNVRKVMDL